jgi:hypothetical protein
MGKTALAGQDFSNSYVRESESEEDLKKIAATGHDSCNSGLVDTILCLMSRIFMSQGIEGHIAEKEWNMKRLEYGGSCIPD